MTVEIYFVGVVLVIMLYVIIVNYVYLEKVLPSIGKRPSFMPSGQIKDIQQHVALLKEKKEYPWYFHILNNIQTIMLIILLSMVPVFLRIFGFI